MKLKAMITFSLAALILVSILVLPTSTKANVNKAELWMTYSLSKQDTRTQVGSTLENGYDVREKIGYILAEPDSSKPTVPLYIGPSLERPEDTITTTYPLPAKETLGYIYVNQEPGTIPLYLKYDQNRNDKRTQVEAESPAGYDQGRILGYIYPTETQQLYYMPVVPKHEVYNDSGSGSDNDVSIWRAGDDVIPPGYVRATQLAKGSYGPPSNSEFVYLLKAHQLEGQEPLLKAPSDYFFMWNDKGSGGTHDGSIWGVNCPSGYGSLGDIATGNYSKPALSETMCVNMDLLTTSMPTQNDWIWSDKGSGGNNDVTLFRVGNAGGFISQADYDGPKWSLFGLKK
ncbi:Vps62-related protein (plasmid) [Bacillus carboniphilus]|uniref:Vps62-related protein n=1 Tax=Bacillus carboniphilus TaxID=86663 RepID=A0ABY9JYH1_9BACI|nr:Vps62-related protein [Bacillus carboniphilus]WLR44451.1 Vps62-related protein [Bacillus carboniphilus]